MKEREPTKRELIIPEHLQLESRKVSTKSNLWITISTCTVLLIIGLLTAVNEEVGVGIYVSMGYLCGVTLTAISGILTAIALSTEGKRPLYLSLHQPLVGVGTSDSQETEGYKITFPMERLIEKPRGIHILAQGVFQVAFTCSLCVGGLFLGVVLPKMYGVFSALTLYTNILLYSIHLLPPLYSTFYLYTSHILLKLSHIWVPLIVLGAYFVLNWYFQTHGVNFYTFMDWNGVFTFLVVIGTLALAALTHYIGVITSMAKYTIL